MKDSALGRLGESATLQRWLRRLAPFFPWVSLGWGLVTASLITRNIANPGRFVAAGAFFVLLSLGLQIVSSHSWKEARFGAGKKVFGFVSSLILQSAAQYFLMFALPFLYLGRYWFALGLSAVFAAVTLWDPWWAWAFKHPVMPIVLRQWVSGLLVSSIIVAFMPSLVAFTSLAVLFTAVYLSHFWSVWRPAENEQSAAALGADSAPSGNGLPARFVSLFWGFGRTLAVLLLPAAAGLQLLTRTSTPFPLLGVWLQQPAFTFGKPSFLDRDTFGPTIHSLDSMAIQSDAVSSALLTEICCVTPIIASPNFGSRIEHHWLLNGLEFETIVLPLARGNGEGAAFRTYSCKRQFARLKVKDVIGCDARVLGGTSIGSITISVAPGIPQ